MRKLFILIFIVVIVNTAFSQGPGYLGNHFILKYNYATSIAFFEPNKDLNSGYKYANKKHEIGFDYVIDRGNTLGLTFSAFSTGLSFRSLDYLYYYYKSQWGGMTEGYDNLDLSEYFGSINAKCFSLNYKSFESALAPVGIYTSVYLNYYTYEVDYDSNALKTEVKNQLDEPTAQVPSFYKKDKYRTLGIGAGVGYNRIFFDRVILNIELSSVFTLGGLMYLYHWADDIELTPENYIDNMSQYRLLGHEVLSLKIGVGVLIF